MVRFKIHTCVEGNGWQLSTGGMHAFPPEFQVRNSVLSRLLARLHLRDRAADSTHNFAARRRLRVCFAHQKYVCRIMKLVHKIWAENFSRHCNFQSFLSFVPRLSAVTNACLIIELQELHFVWFVNVSCLEIERCAEIPTMLPG